MIILFLFYLLIVAIAGWFLITQIGIPIYKQTKLFPMFQPEEKLRAKLENTHQRKVERELEKKIKREEASSNPKMSAIVDDEV
jgi:hypothetical protein